MSERIDEIVETTIRYSGEILKEDPTRWPVARRGIKTMIANLAEGAPDHPALAKLQAFCEQEQAHYESGSSAPKPPREPAV